VLQPPDTMIDVISSREKADKHGPGWLLVDGKDESVFRTATIAFRPSTRQARSLDGLLGACCEVYNAALQERRDAWRRSKTSIGLFDQFKQVKDLRGVRDDVLAWGIRPIRGSLCRLDEAYTAFYRRVKAGQSPGFPRFKSRKRFNTVGWDEPQGWKLNLGAGTLRVQGVGVIKLSKGALGQLARLKGRDGTPTTLTLTRRRAGSGWTWRACVVFKGVSATKTGVL
jgi:putative transposase